MNHAHHSDYKMLVALGDIKRAGKSEGKIPCPACAGFVAFEVTSDGTVSAQCETIGCMAFTFTPQTVSASAPNPS